MSHSLSHNILNTHSPNVFLGHSPVGALFLIRLNCKFGTLEVGDALDLLFDGVRLPYSSRKLTDIEPVLFDRELLKNTPSDRVLYKMYRNAIHGKDRVVFSKNNLRFDITVMSPDILGKECNKTLGHRHPDFVPGTSYAELYQVLHGEARFLLQKYCGGSIIEFKVIRASDADVVLIPPNYGHVTVNCGKTPLVLTNLVADTFTSIYAEYVALKGAAYYLLTSRRLVPNPSYSNLPKPVFAKSRFHVDRDLYVDFLNNPERFAFLVSPTLLKNNS